MQLIHRVVGHGVIVGIGILLLGCSLAKDPNAGLMNNSGANHAVALAAFEKSVYTITSNQCVGCHGRGIGPQFAVADIEQAYTLSKSYADFTDPSLSVFVSRMMDGHCGADCSTDGSRMTAAIQEWWDEGESIKDAGGLNGNERVTPDLALPNPLPTGATYYTLQWDLGVISEGIAATYFTIEIQQFDAEAYRVRNPKLRTTDRKIDIADIKVLVNGIYDPGSNDYTVISALLLQNTIRILSPALMLVLQDRGPAEDKIAISFGKIESVP